QRDAIALDARLEPGEVVAVAAEREVVQPLALAFDHEAPAVLVAIGIEPQRVAVLAHIEAEILVEVLRWLEVGNRQHEMVERVDADRLAIGGWGDVATDGGHRISPWAAVAPV